jgi:hypothetical protein
MLSIENGTNITSLVRKTNSTYNETMRNLKILEGHGVVIISHLGRVVWIRLDRENPKTIVLLQVLKTLESKANTQYFNS